MPERTVRHALVSYEERDDLGRPITRRVFRGETHDFPQAVIDRHESHGAFMEEVGQEPPVFGELAPITANSTAEEVQAFVRSATVVELATFVRDHPEFEDKIGEAMQGLMLPPLPEGPTTIDGLQAHPPSGEDLSHVPGEEDGDLGDDDEDPLDLLTPEEIVNRSLSEIGQYLGRHPELANNVLQAENDRTDNNPRAGVQRLTEAAAAHAE